MVKKLMQVPTFQLFGKRNSSNVFKVIRLATQKLFSFAILAISIIFIATMINKKWLSKKDPMLVNSNISTSNEQLVLQQQRQAIAMLQQQIERLNLEHNDLSQQLAKVAENNKQVNLQAKRIASAELLEKDLVGLEKDILANYEKMLAKKELVGELNIKCAASRRGHKSCQELESLILVVETLNEELQFQKKRREDLQLRINYYLQKI